MFKFLNYNMHQQSHTLAHSKICCPLSNTSRREEMLFILRSLVITWPAALYINEEVCSDAIK